MADFIAMIRMEEAAADEEEYWRTHSFARIKRDIGVSPEPCVACVG